MDIVQARERNARALQLKIDTQQWQQDKLSSLQAILQPFTGGSCPVELHVLHRDAEAILTCGAQWYITPEDQLLHELKHCLGERSVTLSYH